MILHKKAPLIVFCCVLFSLVLSCGSSKNEERKKNAAQELKKIAAQINDDFIHIREEIKYLADYTAGLYQKEKIEENLKLVNPSKYRLHENGVFYKPENDGRSAVFVSGFVPVNEDIKKSVYFTEPLDLVLKQICMKYPEVVQSYYNDKNSYNRIYPYFDVLTQYEPKMNIPEFNFYYLADEKHNPEKKVVWVKEPYVDPAGRGWMVSVIAPVYVNGKLEGVPGLDVTIDTITSRYIGQKNNNLMILDASGMVVSIQEYLASLFSLPMLKNHKYLETIRMDTYLPADFNLLQSKARDVREMADSIFKKNQTEVEFKKGKEIFIVMAETIPELDWKILKVIHK